MSPYEQVELQLAEWVLHGHRRFHIIYCLTCKGPDYIATGDIPWASLTLDLNCHHRWTTAFMASADDILTIIKPQ